MFVFSNLAISVDGKIATADRSITHLGSPRDLRHMLELRRRADAVLFGASTLRAYGKPCHAPGARKNPLNVVWSSRLAGISPSLPFFMDTAVERLLVVSAEAPTSRLRLFESRAEILKLKSDRAPVIQVLERLKRRGVKRLLVEGGGTTMWDFVERDLIDEYHVTLTPQLIGGNSSPTLVDGAGFSPERLLKLRLKSLRRVGDELFLIYVRGGEKRRRATRRRP